jgi:hypothetical protein
VESPGTWFAHLDKISLRWRVTDHRYNARLLVISDIRGHEFNFTINITDGKILTTSSSHITISNRSSFDSQEVISLVQRAAGYSAHLITSLNFTSLLPYKSNQYECPRHARDSQAHQLRFRRLSLLLNYDISVKCIALE